MLCFAWCLWCMLLIHARGCLAVTPDVADPPEVKITMGDLLLFLRLFPLVLAHAPNS